MMGSGLCAVQAEVVVVEAMGVALAEFMAAAEVTAHPMVRHPALDVAVAVAGGGGTAGSDDGVVMTKAEYERLKREGR